MLDTSLSVSVSDNLISSTSSPARYNIGSLLITYRSPVVTLQKRIEQEKLCKKMEKVTRYLNMDYLCFLGSL